MNCRILMPIVFCVVFGIVARITAEPPAPLAYWKLNDVRDGKANEANGGPPLIVSTSGDAVDDERRGKVLQFQLGEGISLPDAVLGEI